MPDRLAPDAEGIARAAELLLEGELVAFPTDTVYGLGCRGGDPVALARLFAAKRRPAEKAVPWLVASLDEALAAGFTADPRARSLAERFWPGALTMVLASTDGSSTQAFRIPDHPVTLAILAAAGPLAVSSANRSGEPETHDADDVLVAFADSDEPAAVVDGGRIGGGVASSVVDLSGVGPRLLREGALPRTEIEAVIGPID
ncbi:MAG: L-threonylcarbamoyladenylate synthase [Chloroflexota bacterium]